MKTADIYNKYNLMPQLITHQLRVAGIAKIISQDWEDQKQRDLGIRTCLLHDMGNMAKFVGLTDPYWQNEQKNFWNKWGTDAHEATYAIITELGFNDILKTLREEDGVYNNFPLNPHFEQASKSALLVLYGDLRVAMSGVVSLDTRVDDLAKRYPNNIRPERVWSNRLEKYMQSLTSRNVAMIVESDIAPLFDELLNIDW